MRPLARLFLKNILLFCACKIVFIRFTSVYFKLVTSSLNTACVLGVASSSLGGTELRSSRHLLEEGTRLTLSVPIVACVRLLQFSVNARTPDFAFYSSVVVDYMVFVSGIRHLEQMALCALPIVQILKGARNGAFGYQGTNFHLQQWSQTVLVPLIAFFRSQLFE